ncbi:cytochrome c biogenesis protein CcdA [Fulvivirgaceae bacterium BMA10]|uniref:Cytochrome c biogenesis protein CcdA n=1 Tax=Splendidivirga corallicola TaxID=3051826 RepID=A0ABT8KV07_9BACT|nr:cytochrome c biogenesis protein CcdA [Fulvivirgaceae bacterium BMA10]
MGLRFLILIFFGAFISIAGSAQVLEPAKWSYDVSHTNVKIGDEIELIFKATIQEDWYLYSSDFDPDCGPTVTTFTFKENDTYELIGEIKPINAKKKYDEIFECDYTYFRNQGEFRQKIKVLKAGLQIAGGYEYQVCTDVDGKCIPFEDEFVFRNFKVQPTAQEEKANGLEKATDLEKSTSPIKETPKVEKENVEENTSSVKTSSAGSSIVGKSEEGFPIKKLQPFFDGDFEKEKVSHIWFMVLAFLAGLAALFTPCVFPMIPMTVSFFTKKDGNKGKGISQAIFYGFCIILIYTIIGSIISPFMGPETANHLSTEWLPNVIFFAVFVIFALSFFGMFDIVLPSSFVNSVDRKADRGGFIGVFFMAFTLVLVSFSCTGPIVGTILVESAGGEVLKPVLGMFAFSLAFAIPFTLFAIFPGWLNNLPKSGGWLNAVKVVLGFIELALAFKFLSIADQAFHWGILDREVNIAVWVVIFGLMGLYLLGKIKLPHDSPSNHISVPRLMLAIATLSFVVYLIPGMFGAPLKALAGYLPPMHTHDFDIPAIARSSSQTEDFVVYNDQCEKPKYEDFLHLPHGLKGYFDLDQAVACAKEQNKPLFIDFTGHGCTNCREMEAVVWSDPRVLKKLKEDFVVVALYVDDKTELPEDSWYVSAYDNKIKKTIGKQNADLQIQRVNNNAQPNYILLDHAEKGLVKPVAYDRDVQNFLDFLDEGLKNFHQNNQLAMQSAE